MQHRIRHGTHAHARYNPPHNGMVRGQLGYTLRFPPVGAKPVDQPVLVGAAALKGQQGLAPDVVRATDGAVPFRGDDHQFLRKGVHAFQPVIFRHVHHKNSVQPVLENILV